MKINGVVIDFDKYNGLIKGADGKEYILNYKEITEKDNTNISNGDYVEFYPETFKTVEVYMNVARNIKKVLKEEEITNESKSKGI